MREIAGELSVLRTVSTDPWSGPPLGGQLVRDFLFAK